MISVAIERRAFVAIEPSDELILNSLDAGVSKTIRARADLALAPYPTLDELRNLDLGAIESRRRMTYLNVLKAVLAGQSLGLANGQDHVLERHTRKCGPFKFQRSGCGGAPRHGPVLEHRARQVCRRRDGAIDRV